MGHRRRGKLWLTQSRPITTLYPLPTAAGRCRRTRALPVLQPCPGPDPAPHPDGPGSLPADRVLRGTGSQLRRAGSPQRARRRTPRPGSASSSTSPPWSAAPWAGQSSPGSSTSWRPAPRRSCAGSSPTPGSPSRCGRPWPLLRHVVPVAARARVPETLLRALFRPEAALRRVDRFTRDFSEPPSSFRPGHRRRQRLDHAERILGAALSRSSRPSSRCPPWGLRCWPSPESCCGGRPRRPGDLQPVLRGLPNNVTTEMDLELWRLATAIRADAGVRRSLLTGQPPAALAQRLQRRRTARRRCSPGWPDSWTGTGTAPSRKSTSACPAGPTTPPISWASWRTTSGWMTPRWPRTGSSAKAAAEAEAQMERLVAEARRPGPAPRHLVRAALRRARLFAGLRELPNTRSSWPWRRSAGSWPTVGSGARRGRHASPRRRHLLPRLRRSTAGGLDGADLQELVAERRAAYDPELERRHIPAGAAVRRDRARNRCRPAAGGSAAERRPDGGSPGSAGTVTAPARVILDPVGAHLEPGEILVAPSTDPGLDPAVPHRRRTGDGNGRPQLARRRGGPGVRHPGGRGRPRCHVRLRHGPGSNGRRRRRHRGAAGSSGRSPESRAALTSVRPPSSFAGCTGPRATPRRLPAPHRPRSSG